MNRGGASGGWWRRTVVPLVSLMSLLALGVAETRAGDSSRLELGDGRAVVFADTEVRLEVPPERGEGLLALAERITGRRETWEVIARLNGTSELAAGRRYAVPFDLLDDESRRAVMQRLFPHDRLQPSGWEHRVGVGSLAGGETLWSVARWFTGDGGAFRQIREANRLEDVELEAGQTLWIPAKLLRASLRSLLPSGPADAQGAALRYQRDEEGAFAVYRLQPGEALYSSVVVRFTGRVFAEDVNAIAAEIAAASDIDDVTDIRIGHQVRIPFDLLLPEYLPLDHPRRQAYEAGLSDSLRFSNRVTSRHLDGITVVLDAGHGGADVGASTAGVWESVYVYDVMVRVKRLLEERTAARVVATVRDGESFQIAEQDIVPFSRRHRVLTSPPYPIQDATVGVNLRWYLANSVYRQALRSGGDADKVVFLSIHADSLHPSLRGVMVYIPSAQLTGGRRGRSGSVYQARREVREQPIVEFSWRQRVESEGLSREMATAIVDAYRERGLPVHPYKPVREKIILKRREFVPAVLRYNAIPAKALVEICNLMNDEDRKLLQSRRHRQRMAEAIVAGLLAYYGEDPPETPTSRVAAAR